MTNVYWAQMTKERQKKDNLDFGVRVGAVVERAGSVLLVRHDKPDREPYWVLPGGRLEPGETIPECAGRELSEEAHLEATFSRILYVSEFMRDGRHTVDVTVLAVVEPGEEASLGSDPEVEEGSEPTLTDLRWVALDGLREIELLPPWIKSRMAEDAGAGWTGEVVYLGSGRD